MRSLQRCLLLKENYMKASMRCRHPAKRTEVRLQQQFSSKSTGPLKSTKDYTLHSVKVNTCSKLYQRLYESCEDTKRPLTGVDFDVVYADTMPSPAKDVPVVLAVHGVAGSHTNFDPVLPFLTSTNLPPVRIIVPNLPGCGYTELDSAKAFGHTEEERALLILDFLDALNISKVQVLVAHSAGAYTALSLSEKRQVFESIVFINPGGLKPVKLLASLKSYRFILPLINIPILRQLFFSAARVAVKDVDAFKTASDDVIDVALKSLLYTDFKKMRQLLVTLALRHFPVVLAMSKKDPVTEMHDNEEMLEIFELSSGCFREYNDGVEIRTKPTNVNGSTSAKAFIFDRSDHFVLKSYPEIIANEISRLLKLVVNHSNIMQRKLDYIPKLT